MQAFYTGGEDEGSGCTPHVPRGERSTHVSSLPPHHSPGLKMWGLPLPLCAHMMLQSQRCVGQKAGLVVVHVQLFIVCIPVNDLNMVGFVEEGHRGSYPYTLVVNYACVGVIPILLVVVFNAVFFINLFVDLLPEAGDDDFLDDYTIDECNDDEVKDDGEGEFKRPVCGA